jgi:hypothetical protein
MRCHGKTNASAFPFLLHRRRVERKKRKKKNKEMKNHIASTWTAHDSREWLFNEKKKKEKKEKQNKTK